MKYTERQIEKVNNTDEVISMVCKNYQVSIDEIRSKSRKKEVRWPRQVICFLLYRMGNLSYKEIGLRVMRDHATVIHSVKVVEDTIAIYGPIKSEVMELLSLINFGIQTSANINTNPRTENGSITIGKEIYEFYKNFFDGIKSFE